MSCNGQGHASAATTRPIGPAEQLTPPLSLDGQHPRLRHSSDDNIDGARHIIVQ